MSFIVRALLLSIVVGGLSNCLAAQHLDPFFNQSQFAQWFGEGPQRQLPWRVQIRSGGLTVYQRIAAFTVIDVDGSYVTKRPTAGDLVAMVQFTDDAGLVYQDHSILSLEGKEPNLPKGVFFAWREFVLPGKYDVAAAVYDPVSGKHNFARYTLHVEPLRKDPLPEAWSDLPSLEFLQAPEEPDSFFLPELLGRLHLPLATRRPVRIELLANLSGTGREMSSHSAYNLNMAALLPILKTFSQIDVRDGVFNLGVLDLMRQWEAFRQEDARKLDWPRLKAAVLAADPTTIDVRSLADARHMAAFLRDEVARRIAPPSSPEGALPVLILVSSSASFESLADITETSLPAACDCLVYYIRYNPFALRYRRANGDFDNVKKVLKPLQVRGHVANSPEDLRRIMAEILEEVSRM